MVGSGSQNKKMPRGSARTHRSYERIINITYAPENVKEWYLWRENTLRRNNFPGMS